MTSHPPKPHRILITDDNPAIHEDFSKILQPAARAASAKLDQLLSAAFGKELPVAPKAEGFELSFALNGADALNAVVLAKAENKPFALAFVDIRMPPGWDGVETITRLWEFDPHLQVVICTAYSDYTWSDILRKLGVSDRLLILKKPFDTAEVLQMAHALCCKWQLGSELRTQMLSLDQLVKDRTKELQDANLNLRTEIYERSVAQSRYQLSEERLAAAYDASPLPTAILDANTFQTVRVNRALLELSAPTFIETRGRTIWEYGVIETPEMHAHLASVREGGATLCEGECRICTAGGVQHIALVWIAPFSLHGGPHLLVILQDITRQRELERHLVQTQKMEAIGQLAAGMAHDFNNLLTVIGGYADILCSQSDAKQSVQHAAHEIAGASDRAALLIRKMLAFSRKDILEKAHVEVNRMIRKLDPMFRSLLPENVELEMFLEEDLPLINADAGSLDQVLLNLVINARDAMPNGGILHIQSHLLECSSENLSQFPNGRVGSFVCLSVQDSGMGISTTVINRIFEPFFTTKRPGKGTGLGLAMSHGIVAQHGGWIDVHSEEGRGARFTLYFPTVDAPPIMQPATVVVSQPVLGRGETILLVEDNSAVRELAEVVLGERGYKIVVAQDGNQAMDLWSQRQEEISIVFSDIVMPGDISGIDLARQIRGMCPATRIILSSGYSDIQSGENLEGVQLLPKPYSAKQLIEAVLKTLEN